MPMTIIVLVGDDVEKLMAKAQDALDALNKLNEQVNGMVTALGDAKTAQSAPAADDPALQEIVDLAGQIGTRIDQAVADYRAAHPAAVTPAPSTSGG